MADPRELEASVVGNEPAELEVFGPGEIIPGREFYDYVAKYRSAASRTLAEPEPPLDPELRERARRTAREVYLAIGAAGFARVDFLLAGDGTLFVSEINTIPGLHADQPVPGAVRRGRLQLPRHLRAHRGTGDPAGRQRPTRHLTRADLP